VTTRRIIPAAQLRAGPATIIVALGDRTTPRCRLSQNSVDGPKALCKRRAMSGDTVRRPWRIRATSSGVIPIA